MALTQHWALADNAASTTVVATVGTNGTLLGGDNTSVKSAAGPGGSATLAFDLNGTDDAVDIAASAISFASGAACSFSAWFKLDGTTGRIFGNSGGSNNNSIRITADTTVIVRPTSTSLTFTVPALGTTAWHHILVTKTAGDSWRVFIDGVESVTGAQAGAVTMAVNRLGLATTSFHDGKLAYCKVFDSDESANVASLYAEGLDVPVITYNGGNPATIEFQEGLVTTAVATITATGTGVTYSLSGTDAARFSIGSSTGILTAAVALNYESPTDANTDNTYLVTVTATNPAGNDTIALTINVVYYRIAPVLVRVSMPTSVTTFDVTVPGLGVAEQIRGAIVWGNNAAADGTPVDDAQWCYGFVTGTGTAVASGVAEQIAHANRMSHGESTNTDAHSENCAYCWNAIGRNASPTSIETARITLNSKITDGLRFNMVDPPATAQFLHVLLFAGNVQTKIYVVTASDVQGNSVDQTISFEPNLIIAAGNGDQYGGSMGHGGFSAFTLTFFGNDKAGTVTQAGLTIAKRALDSTASDNAGYISTSFYPHWDPLESATVHSSEHDLTFPNSTTLRWTTTLYGSDAGAEFAFFCVDYGSTKKVAVGIATIPTSTGSQAITLDPAPAFTPESIAFLTSRITAINTDVPSSALASVSGIAAVSRPDLAGEGELEFHNSQCSEQGVTPVNSQSQSDDQLIYLPDHTGANAIAGTFTSFSSGGLTVNLTAAPGTALKWPFMAVGEVSASSSGNLLLMGCG